MRSRRSLRAALVLLLTGLAFATLAAWSMASRSTIPIALDGRVTAIDVRHEKHPGVDDVWLVGIDGHARHVDHAVARLLHEGAQVRKDAWDRTMSIDGVTHRLELSADARRMLLLAPAMALAFAVLTVAVARREPRGVPGESPAR